MRLRNLLGKDTSFQLPIYYSDVSKQNREAFRTNNPGHTATNHSHGVLMLGDFPKSKRAPIEKLPWPAAPRMGRALSIQSHPPAIMIIATP